MSKSLIKILSIVLIVSLNWSAISAIGSTWAHFNDTETSSGNTCSAGILDFSWSSAGDFSPDVTPKQSSSRNITLTNDGSLGFKYDGSVSKTGGNDTVCNALKLGAKLDGNTKYPYSGSSDTLLGFNLESLIEFSDPTDDWEFIVTLDSIDPALEGQSCNFDIIFDGEQLNSASGFTDQETIPSTVTVGSSTGWTQTSQADFEGGVLSGVDTTTSPGDIILATTKSLDQSQTSQNKNSPKIDGAYREAQTFKAGLSGKLTDITIRAKRSGTQTKPLIVELRDATADEPSSIILASAERNDISTEGEYNFTFTSPPTVSAGTKYSIVIKQKDNGPDNYWVSYRDSNIYADGRRLTSSDGGSTWTGTTHDLYFKTFIETYSSSGTLESQSFDGAAMTRWQSLEWDETLPSGNTDITLAVATSNDNSTWSAWQLSSGTSPIDLTTLPETRYIKWKATLTTTDTNETPVLHEVRVKYYPGAAAEHIVLNEFLPNPEGEAYGFDFGQDWDLMPKGEWIEIYNKPGGSVVDLASWYIQDQSGNTIYITGSNTHTGSTIIGANSSGSEWLVVYMNQEILDNTGDTIYLYDMNGNLIDSYSYDLSGYCELEPTPGDENDGAPVENCPDEVPGNKSYARIPDGIGAWIDPIPTPGTPNQLSEEEIQELAGPESQEDDIELEQDLEQDELELEEGPAEGPTEEQLPEEEPADEEVPGTGNEEVPTTEEEPAEENEPSEEEETTEEEPTGEEEPTQEEAPAIEEETAPEEVTEEAADETITDETIDEGAEGDAAVDETTVDETTGETVEETTEGAVEETVSGSEGSIIDEAPASEEIAAIVPDNNSSDQGGAEQGNDNAGAGSGEGGSNVGDNSGEGTGASSSESAGGGGDAGAGDSGGESGGDAISE